MIKNLLHFFNIFFVYLFFTSNSFADLQENLINKISSTKTLSFDFMQKIADKKEVGICYIKYPLLMRCKYNNLKEKVMISNGKKLVIIKKKI